jgi:hypothetical protein
MPDFPRGEWKKGQPEPDVTKLTARPVQSGSSWEQLPIGLFITVSPHGLKALLHRSNLPEDFRTSFSIGQSLYVVVMYHRQSRWLEFVNRSKRLKTWSHLKVAAYSNKLS